MKTWKDKNASRTRQSCEYLLRQLKAQYMDPLLNRVSDQYGTKVRYADITSALKTVENEFYRRAYGDSYVKYDVFFKFNQVKI